MDKINRKHHLTGRAGLLSVSCAVLATGALAGLTGCGTSAAGPHASKTVTITFWNEYNETDQEASTMKTVVIPRFEKLNPGIKVDDITYPTNPEDQMLQKFLAAAAAGTPPDVMRSDIAWVPQLAAQGVLLQSDSLPFYSSIKQNALPGPLATTEYKGKHYGFPLDTNTQVLFWNKADFAAAGISAPPTTLTQLFSDARTLTVKSKQQYGLGVDGTDIWNVAPYVWSLGGSFTNSDYTTATGYMNSQATEAAVTVLDNLYKAGDIGTDFAGGASAVSGEQGFPKGQYAMYIDGPWAVPTYEAMNPVPNYGMALFPAGNAGSFSTVGGEDVVISKDSAHLAQAEKFVQFLDSSFSQLAMAKVGQMSAFKSDAAAEVKATPYYQTFTQQLLTAKDRPVSQGYSQLDTDFSNALQSAIAGKATVAQALAGAAQQSDSALASQ